MLRIGLQSLETLFWISRLGTFTAAAERLNTTQSAISSRIRELEARLGTRLFQKVGRNMALTARGREIVTECEPLLNALEQVLLDASGEAFSGSIRIGSGEIAALVCLPQLLARLTRSMPRVTWDVDIDLTINLRQKLDSNQLDLAFLVGPIDGAFLSSTPIGKVQLLWAGSRDFLKRAGPPMQLFTSPCTPIWTLSRPSYQYQLTVDVVRRFNGNPQAIHSTTNVRNLIDIVLANGGIAMVPACLVTRELQSGRLVALRDEGIHGDSIIEFFAVTRRLQNDSLLHEVYRHASECTIPSDVQKPPGKERVHFPSAKPA